MKEKTVFQTTDFQEYMPDETIWASDSYKVLKIKKIVFDDLTEVERRIILLYAELGSYKKLGVVLHVSTSTAFNQVKFVRDKILKLI